MPADEMGNRSPPMPPDVSSRVVLICIFGFMAFAALSMAGLMLYMRWLVPGPLNTERHSFPEPSLQISPQGDLDRFKVEQRGPLAGYEWADRGAGIVRIPIEDAMRIVAARGPGAYEPAGIPAVTPGPGSRGTVRP